MALSEEDFKKFLLDVGIKPTFETTEKSEIPEPNPLTEHQNQVMNDILEALKNNKKKIVLKGSAGVGKTFLVQYLIKEYRKIRPSGTVVIAAPTNRAVSVLMEKQPKPPYYMIFQTIHKALFLKRHINEKTGVVTFKPDYNPKRERPFKGCSLVIVDEASKVTFSDFIVPALHAKKWILVGDVKQLSPYVENDYVSENIASMLGEAQQQAIVKQFELKVKLADKRFDDCLKIFFTETDINSDFNSIKSEYPNLHILKIDNATDEKQILEINTADILVCMNSGKVKEFLSKNLFVKSIVVNGSFKRDFGLTFRQHYIHKRELPEFTSKDEEWAEMVSSRLNQSFSFRNAGEEFSNIDKELKYLIPNKIKDEVYQIRRLVFPSILELLQNGVGKGEGQRNDRVLSDGFNRTHKQSRFNSLSYQHRMHPDIAKTSRENFYENNLQSANTVKENRGWNYALNEPVVKWIHNNDKTGNIKGNKIINPTEVNDIEKELLKFLAWAKNNPKPDGEHYEVAVLTFYLNQESELRRRIRKITKQSNFSKFHKDNTDIFLYTVDKFQGQEADLVLLSFTKFTRDAHFNSPNRLNVALTRARFKLVLFGNKEWFKRSAKLKALRDLATNFESIIRYEK